MSLAGTPRRHLWAALGLGLCALQSACAQDTPDEIDEALLCASATGDLTGEQAHGFAAPVPVHSRATSLPLNGTHVVYLNREARTYVAGMDDAQAGSSSVLNARGLPKVSLPGFRQGDAAWREVVSCIREEYARFDIAVTDVRPVTPGYMEAHFGGSGTELAMFDGSGGIAPIDSTRCDVVEGAVAFVFSDLFGKNLRSLCEVGAHEIGHPFSLDHVYRCKDPMTYVAGCGEKEFQPDDSPCGENGERACICGRASQNSVSILTKQLGERRSDLVQPSVELLPPLPDPSGQGTYVQVRAHDPNGALAAVELHIVADGRELAAICGDGSIPCTLDQELASFAIPTSLADQRIWAVAQDTGGNRTSSLETVVRAVPAKVTELALVIAPIATRYQAGDSVELQALVVDRDPIAEAVLVWQDGTGTTREVPLCQHDNPANSGRVSADLRAETRYGVSMRLGQGDRPRSFHLRVTDARGRTTQSPEVSVPLAPSAP